MNILINNALRDTIDPLTNTEYLALERSLLTEGCRDALVLWGETLIDGHNRYRICQKHGIAFQTTQNERFQSIEDVQLWLIDNHLARRSVSGFQRGVLALRKKEIVSARRKDKGDKKSDNQASANQEHDPVSVDSRDEIAKLAGISKPAVAQIEKIRKTAAPELVDAVRAGTISINAAATIASLPNAEQVAAVAGGKKELQQAARQVRQLRAPVAPKPIAETDVSETVTAEAAPRPISNLQDEVTALRTENLVLKEKIAELTAQLANQSTQ